MASNAVVDSDINRYEIYLNKTGKSNSTCQKYIRDIGRFQLYLIENNYELSTDVVEEYILYLKDSSYSISSINSIIAAINSFADFIGRKDIHCSSLKKDKKIITDSELLTVDEYSRLLRTAIVKKDYRMAMLIQVIANMDIRLNELEKLTVDALDSGQINVIRLDEKVSIIIPEQLRDGLYEYIDKQNIHEGIIFCTSSGKVVERSNIWKQLKKLAIESNINPDKVYPQNLKQKLAKKYFSIIY